MQRPTGSGGNLLSVTSAALLLSGCVGSASFGTETRAAWCQALIDNAPSASVDDTAKTQEDVADIGEVIWLLCREHSSE